ncbi:hypothetical protein EDD85DRAFT_857773, partial [Armillaria nabsnona]
MVSLCPSALPSLMPRLLELGLSACAWDDLTGDYAPSSMSSAHIFGGWNREIMVVRGSALSLACVFPGSARIS